MVLWEVVISIEFGFVGIRWMGCFRTDCVVDKWWGFEKMLIVYKGVCDRIEFFGFIFIIFFVGVVFGCVDNLNIYEFIRFYLCH